MTTRLRRAPASVALALLLLAGVSMAALPASAQQVTDNATVQLVITSLTGVVGPINDEDPNDDEPASEDLVMRVLVINRGDTAVSDLKLTVEVHPRVGGARSVLQRALDDQVVGANSGTVIEDLDIREGEEVLAGDIAALEVRIDGDRLPWRGTEDVYPVEVAALRGRTVLDRVVTAVVHMVDRPAAPLQTAVTWPIAMEPTQTVRGRYREPLPDELAEGGRLDLLLSTVERHPDAPVVLVPDAVTLEELADRADGFTLVDGTEIPDDHSDAVAAAGLLDRIRALIDSSGQAPLVGPYAGTDIAALASGGGATEGLARRALDVARSRVQETLGVAADTSVYPATTTVTPDVARLVGPVPLLLSYHQATLPDLGSNADVPPARQTLELPGRDETASALVADPHVARIVDAPPVRFGATIVQQRLVAETALLYLTAPTVADRALLLLPPSRWDPPSSAAQPLLDALVDAAWLELVPPAEAAAGPAEAVPRRTLSSSTALLPASVNGELAGVRQLLDGLAAATEGLEPALDGQTVTALDDALLRAVTPDSLADGAGDALARIGRVADVAEEAFGTVELDEGARITLASDTGSVPITLQRTSGGPIRVLVEIDSAGRLVWEDEDQRRQETLAPGSTLTISFETQAVSRGTFPVQVSVWDPTHVRLLDRTELSVRSTAINTTALYVVGGVVVLLLLAGARWRRTPKLEVVR